MKFQCFMQCSVVFLTSTLFNSQILTTRFHLENLLNKIETIKMTNFGNQCTQSVITKAKLRKKFVLS